MLVESLVATAVRFFVADAALASFSRNRILRFKHSGFQREFFTKCTKLTETAKNFFLNMRTSLVNETRNECWLR
jgi:hypothetical protein